MESMYIGSGDVSSLLAGKNTQAFKKLLKRFVSDEKPYYNAKASPINALRTGAILEDRYYLYLSDDYYSQCKSICIENDILISTIDFAKYNNGNISEFQELKTCQFDDFLKLRNADIDYIKKSYKNNYNQIQHQLLCTGLMSATLVFLVVYEYDDEINYNRDITDQDLIKYEIKRDKEVISKILDRALFFKNIRDSYEKI
jgi:hypothetical protein